MQSPSSSSLRAPRATRSWLWWVLVGFLWLQFAGVVHKYSHIDGHLKSTQLAQLLPEHSSQNKSDCQLLDLQCSGMALSQALPVMALPAVAVQVTLDCSFVFSASTNHSYLARAPPALI